MNEVARHFLDTLARSGEVDGGWKFSKALEQARLDYSDASLDRLEQLLNAIRNRVKPTLEHLQQSPEGRNFCSLIAFYVVEVMHRRTGAIVDWHDRASAQRALPDGVQLPDVPCARLVANLPDQGAAFLPLGWVEARLSGSGKEDTAQAYVASMIAKAERDAPALWWTAMEAAGRMASWQMMMAADGGSVLPTMLASTKPNVWTALMAGLPGEDLNEALQRGGHYLDTNPEGAAWQVFSYDGIANLREGQRDAVMVLLQTYGESPLQVKIAFPYIPAKDGRALTILDPCVLLGNIEHEKIAMLNGALTRGVDSIKWTIGTTWDQLRKV